jgi:hypothetical protein
MLHNIANFPTDAISTLLLLGDLQGRFVSQKKIRRNMTVVEDIYKMLSVLISALLCVHLPGN